MKDDDELTPRDHAEAVAIFRAQVIGALVCHTDWTHGELAVALRALSMQHVRPPGADRTRCYAPSTLERWYYAWRRSGLDGLRPRRRSDRGHARGLTEAQKELLLAIRRDHPRVATTVILRTLVADGRLAKGAISDTTARRLFAEHGLDRKTLRHHDPNHATERRRWQAARAHDVWHADVMHGPALDIDGKAVPLRIHAILDDRTRYVVALQACTTERESEMLALLVRAVRGHGCPKSLYLDNGPTYIGETLKTACARLGIALVHAKPYDPQARGKMERFWRTLREQCVGLMGPMGSLHAVQARLIAWLDQHYLHAPHVGLLGRSPQDVLHDELLDDERAALAEELLREALTIRQSRRLRTDGTLEIAGCHFELSQGFLAGHKVTVARCLVDPTEAPRVEHDGTRLTLRVVDPVANGRRTRSKRAKRGLDAVPFDPPGTLLRKHLSPTKGGDA
ncbi:MAG: DDE-type integrase/transposase/recombinase [Myxococcota bacterium]